ncbi:hypothetical protein BGU17_19050 [Clostridioides difficile]|nr:hypothetical protein BGU17_19050 [Clostridioides difficile]
MLGAERPPEPAPWVQSPVWSGGRGGSSAAAPDGGRGRTRRWRGWGGAARRPIACWPSAWTASG